MFALCCPVGLGSTSHWIRSGGRVVWKAPVVAIPPNGFGQPGNKLNFTFVLIGLAPPPPNFNVGGEAAPTIFYNCWLIFFWPGPGASAPTLKLGGGGRRGHAKKCEVKFVAWLTESTWGIDATGAFPTTGLMYFCQSGRLPPIASQWPRRSPKDPCPKFWGFKFIEQGAGAL